MYMYVCIYIYIHIHIYIYIYTYIYIERESYLLIGLLIHFVSCLFPPAKTWLEGPMLIVLPRLRQASACEDAIYCSIRLQLEQIIIIIVMISSSSSSSSSRSISSSIDSLFRRRETRELGLCISTLRLESEY